MTQPPTNEKARVASAGLCKALTPPSYPILGATSPGGVLELAAGLDALEYATASAIVAIHPAGIAQAEQAGLAAEVMLAPDLRAIVAACRAARRGKKLDALEGAVLNLMRIGHWGQEWTPESLIDFAGFRPDGPSANQWAAALVHMHERWAVAAEEYGPMYCPPVALGALNPPSSTFASPAI
jgi:hypothetical protein